MNANDIRIKYGDTHNKLLLITSIILFCDSYSQMTYDSIFIQQNKNINLYQYISVGSVAVAIPNDFRHCGFVNVD